MNRHRLPVHIVRDYDIRGVVGQTLDEGDALILGRGLAVWLQRLTGRKRVCVVVGRDCRLSSPMLEAALCNGLVEGGVLVHRIGLSPSPMLYFAETSLEQVDGGVQITGSHNPADHNGFKIVAAGRPVFGLELRELVDLAKTLTPPPIAGRCDSPEHPLLDAYVQRVRAGLDGLDGAAVDRVDRLRIGWDAGNGAAGPAIEALTRLLPGEHCLLFTHPDGTFPNHHPDPGDPANLADLCREVVENKLDFGLAFDGDGDRLGVVDASGRILAADQILMILAEDMLVRHPGATVLGDIKCSQALFRRVDALGGQARMCKTGHAQVKSEMVRTGALLAGEMSGHVFFADDWYGFDDALYAAVRLIAALARDGRSLAERHDALPRTYATPEIRFAVPDQSKFEVISEITARLARENATMDVLDGVRVTTPDGWWLLRASNTQAMLSARAESETPAGLARLLAALDSQLAWCGLAWR